MSNAIALQVELAEPVAEAWLHSLCCELQRGLQGYWFDDRYRYVPERLRRRRILDDHPELAGYTLTIGALKAALNASDKAVL